MRGLFRVTNLADRIWGEKATGEIIYEKTYPKDNWEELIKDLELPQPSISTAESYEGFKKLMSEEIVCVLLPGRQKGAKEFVRVAREISELYELDITITRHVGYIAVDYYFNSCFGLCYLKDVIQLADEIGFYANTHGCEINLNLNYFTHAIFHHGRQLRP